MLAWEEGRGVICLREVTCTCEFFRFCICWEQPLGYFEAAVLEKNFHGISLRCDPLICQDIFIQKPRIIPFTGFFRCCNFKRVCGMAKLCKVSFVKWIPPCMKLPTGRLISEVPYGGISLPGQWVQKGQKIFHPSANFLIPGCPYGGDSDNWNISN